MRRAMVGVALLVTAAGGCSNDNVGRNLRTGASSYELAPPPVSVTAARDYRIGPLDTVDITVFQEADISQRGVVVDAAGNISMPLIGRIQASGRTATELADVLQAKLSERFYVNPQVTVAVTSSVTQRVTVQGEVKEPGLYPISGTATLLDAIALAKGEAEDAALREVVVVRYVDGQRTGAVFDLKRIRRGDDPDPQIEARDVIIVGRSSSKAVWHDVLRAAPLFGVFAVLR